MKSITMTAEQTAIYDADDAAAADMMRSLKREAQDLADKTGEAVEIYTEDGIVADAVTPNV